MTTDRPRQFIEIGIGEESYGLSIFDIHEIIRIQEISPIPNSKHYFIGVINLRSKIVPVISLRRRFGMPEEVYTKMTRIIVVNHEDEMVGIVVDRVNRVASVSESEIQPPPHSFIGAQGSFFSGIAHSEGSLISILMLDKLLNEKR